MKTKPQKRKEYYIHQIIREDNKQTVESLTSNNLYDGLNKTKTVPSYAENIGYHDSPSRYDHLRRQKNADEIARQMYNQEPIIKEDVPPKTQPLSDEDYYGMLADAYVEPTETYVDEVITEDEVNNELVEEDVTSPANEEPAIIKPVVTQTLNEVKAKPKKKSKYVAPPLSLLDKGKGDSEADEELAKQQTKIINDILENYGIKAHVEKHLFGPTVIMYLIQYDALDEDVKSIRKCEQNLSLYLSSKNIRLLTPIPGMPYSGVEVPRSKESRGMVYLGDMLSDKKFINSKMHLPVAVGKDAFGEKVYIDFYDMPHGLAAGATKSGKSICLNAFILSLIYKNTPDDVRLVLIDPKIVEFAKYEQIPHLAMPVITDQSFFEPAVQWLTDEMERRYQILNRNDCTDLVELNEMLEERGQQKVPFIVMIMDEFNDWFAAASNETEINITRLMQKARAAGIHVFLATQRPSADVIKGAIKGNITTRVAFRVSSQADSMVILGQSAAEKLEGYGDMILRHYGMEDTRLQGAFAPKNNVKDVLQFLRDKNTVDYIVTLEEIAQSSSSRTPGNGSNDPSIGRNDEIFKEVAYYVVRNNLASVNQMQKVFGTGFNRMDAIFADLAKLGIITPAQQGAKRKVLVDELQLEEILKNA